MVAFCNLIVGCDLLSDARPIEQVNTIDHKHLHKFACGSVMHLLRLARGLASEGKESSVHLCECVLDSCVRRVSTWGWSPDGIFFAFFAQCIKKEVLSER
jgi:hypothetical protein